MRSGFDGIAMQRFQEQSDPNCRPQMRHGDVLLFIQRMAIVRYGQDRLLSAVQNLSDGDAVMLVAVINQTKALSLR